MRKYLFLPFILLLFAVFTHAHADEYPAKIQWQPPYSLPIVDTKEQSCQAVASFQNKPMLRCFYYVSNGFNSVYVDLGTQPHETAVTAGQRILSCPSGGTLLRASTENPACSAPPCPEGYERQPDGSCLPPPKCDPGQIVSSGYYDIGQVPTNSMPPGGCHRGCVTSPVGDSPVGRQLINGIYHYFARGHYETTSIACQTPGDAPPGLGGIPGPTCGAGQVMGNNGGKTTCNAPKPGDPNVPGKPDNPHKPDDPAPPEEKKEEKDPPVTNPDGSVSQTTRTTNPDGSTTTTTTTTKSDGSSTTTTTSTPATKDPTKTEDPIKDFCSKNPNNKLCKETDERSWGRPDGVGKEFDIPTKDEEIEAKKDEFKLLLQQIRDEIEQVFNWSGAGGGGQLGCSSSVSILGTNFQICLGPYSEQLSQIASGLVFLSLLMALFIILV